MAFYGGLLLLLVATRVFTTIYYIEDFDSLNFASGVLEFNLRANQPHFPGYPVFIVISKGLYWVTGSYAVAFSIIGGISLFTIVRGTAFLMDIKLNARFGFVFLFLFFFNPAFWLMANRYMPDIGGVALLIGCLVFYKRGDYGWFLLLAGVLAGWRISYLPFLIPTVFLALKSTKFNWMFFGAGFAGVILWFVPFVVAVGWEDLMFVAERQIDGHFNDFGGSVVTEPDFVERLVALLENIWAFGLGGWWSGRHWITVLISLGIVGSIVSAVRGGVKIPRWLQWSLISYFVWVLFFQNVLYKSRHELPFLPFIIGIMYSGMVVVLKYVKNWGSIILASYAIALAFLTTNLVVQHRIHFSTFAQVTEELKSKSSATILYSDKLIIDFLKRQGVRLQFREVGDSEWEYSKGVMVLGEYGKVFNRQPTKINRYYHNRYVNKMHESLTLYEY